MEALPAVKKNGKTQAAGQYFGYSLQATRFLMRLLEASAGDTVSLEVFDDVRLHAADGSNISEETKSASSGRNPVSDRATDLWKTFRNWIDAVNADKTDVDCTYFELYVSSQKSGSIVDQFSNADTDDSARIALRSARLALWGAAPDFSIKSAVASDLRPHVETVFAEENEPIACEIIKRFSLVCGSGSPLADIRTRLEQQFVRLELIEPLLIHALGWIKKQTDQLLEQNQPVFITRDAFHLEMTSFIQKHDCRQVLASFAGLPNEADIEFDLNFRTYVNQLEIIDCSDDEKLQAVNDYFRACFDRTKWSELGLVHDSSFDELEEDLTRTWTNKRKLIDLNRKDDTNVNKGQRLYFECSEYKTRLEGLPLPNHFIPGSFHVLSDKEMVGWLPNYREELRKSRNNSR